ncbi:uncharacterized protein LOC125955685 [Anopheles darlingi]|uniref:uncharacterized protein LOC125955685 n=1 Tax=Anopheles darlingi TaxID=43151 RepID=UPI0021004081|nr:uncharacterized protein LOC125955685 [Anopheles darlingi]
MNAAEPENIDLKRSEFSEKHQIGDHWEPSAKDLLELEGATTDSGSEDESASSESSSDDVYEAESNIRWSKKRSFVDRGGGDADVTYDSDWSTDTVIVDRPSKKEPLPESKSEAEPEARAITQEKQSTADLQLESLCEQMKEIKLEYQDNSTSVQRPVDQATIGNIFKRCMDNNDELDREKEEEANAKKQKKQIANEIFQAWLQEEYRRCDGEHLSTTERTMPRPEESVSDH